MYLIWQLIHSRIYLYLTRWTVFWEDFTISYSLLETLKYNKFLFEITLFGYYMCKVCNKND